jgi:hypothetical protein
MDDAPEYMGNYNYDAHPPRPPPGSPPSVQNACNPLDCIMPEIRPVCVPYCTLLSQDVLNTVPAKNRS